MTTRLLFPHKYRLLGWIVFLPSALLGLANLYAEYRIPWLSLSPKNGLFDGFTSNYNLTDEVAAIGIIMGLLLIAFSKEKTEDEMISQLRLESLQWSVYTNYLVLTIAILLVYDADFFSVLVYNMFTLLLVFIGRFRWLIYRNNQLAAA